MASSHRILTSIIRKQRLDGVCNMHYINERGIHSGLWEVDIEDMVVEGTIDIKRWLRNNTGLGEFSISKNMHEGLNGI